MVAVQIALLVLLLSSAGLFTRTLQKLRSVDAGFREDQVLIVNVPTGRAYPGDRRRALYEDLYARFGVLPGVRSVSMSMDTPAGGALSMCSDIEVPGRPENPKIAPTVCQNSVGPHFFETMGIPVLAGRDFDSGDDSRAPDRVVISESVARRYFGLESPLGRQILFRGPVANPRVSSAIIGVVKDVRYTSLRADAPLMIYRPYRQEAGAPANTFVIRTSPMITAEALTLLLRTAVRAAAPTLPSPSVVSLEDRVAGVLVEERMLAVISNAIGGLAAILAAIGVYSTVAAAVVRRRREIGIRMTVGALPGQVARMVVSEALAVVTAGLALGVPAAIATAMADG